MKSAFEDTFWLDNHRVRRQDTSILIVHRMIDLGKSIFHRLDDAFEQSSNSLKRSSYSYYEVLRKPLNTIIAIICKYGIQSEL